MIQTNKTKIIGLVSLGILLGAAAASVAFVFGHSRTMGENEFGIFSLAIGVGFVGTALYLWGLILLAQARGYSGAIVAAASIAGMIMGGVVRALAILILVLPAAIIFSLPDKNRIHVRRRSRFPSEGSGRLR
jgi:hypothetical protein